MSASNLFRSISPRCLAAISTSRFARADAPARALAPGREFQRRGRVTIGLRDSRKIDILISATDFGAGKSVGFTLSADPKARESYLRCCVQRYGWNEKQGDTVNTEAQIRELARYIDEQATSSCEYPHSTAQDE